MTETNPFIKVQSELNIRLQFDDSKVCYKHDVEKFPKGIAMNFNPASKQFECSMCFREHMNEIEKVEATKMAIEWKLNEKYSIFKRESIVPDETILDASFDNYICNEGSEARSNAVEMFEYANSIIRGDKFNIVLNGTPGVGKSHLSYSLLRYVNENSNRTKSCLFVDVSDMVLKIRGSFDDKTSKYTESFFINFLSEVDVLVMDDLGSEVGNIDTDKKASDFVGRVLRNITNSRQNKVTIFTTNLSSVQLNGVYDAKTVSRVLKKIKPVVFKDTKDMRKVDLGF